MESRQEASMHNLIWLGATALFVSLFAADGVRAELESDELSTALSDQGANLSCKASEDPTESRLCEGSQLRWRLCEQGFRSERLPDTEVYGCFIRSL
jgi:hypothetical protein